MDVLSTTDYTGRPPHLVAVTPEEVRDQIIELTVAAGELRYDHVVFANLGPYYDEIQQGTLRSTRNGAAEMPR